MDLRLNDIVKPFLKSDNSLREFYERKNQDSFDLTYQRVVVIILNSIKLALKELNLENNVSIVEIKRNKSKYLQYVEQYELKNNTLIEDCIQNIEKYSETFKKVNTHFKQITTYYRYTVTNYKKEYIKYVIFNELRGLKDWQLENLLRDIKRKKITIK